MEEKRNWKEFFHRKKEKPPLAARPLTKEEQEYEEAKERIYQLHRKEPDLFYVDEAGLYGKDKAGEGWMIGEAAKGSFAENDRIILLDNQGKPIQEAVIKEISTELPQSRGIFKEQEKIMLTVTTGQLSGKENNFSKAFYLIKGKEHKWNECLKSCRDV